MPFDAQINFRSTSGYVTDGTGQTYCIAEAYPVSRNSLTFGWSTGGAFLLGADRITSSPASPELSGMNYINASALAGNFQLDLPAGTYQVRMALGDHFAQTGMQAAIYNFPGSTLLATVISGSDSGADQYYDATGVLRTSAADWKTNNAAAVVTVTGTGLVIRIADSSAGGVGYTALAHLHVTSVTSSSGGQWKRSFPRGMGRGLNRGVA